MHEGQKFCNGNRFRNYVKAMAQQRGWKLCIMDNDRDRVSYEYSDFRCDWQIEGKRMLGCQIFIVTKYRPNHDCMLKEPEFKKSASWLAHHYMHVWDNDPGGAMFWVEKEINHKYKWTVKAIYFWKQRQLPWRWLGRPWSSVWKIVLFIWDNNEDT